MPTLKERRWSKRLLTPAAPQLRKLGHLMLWYAQRLDPQQPERLLQWRALSPDDRLRYTYPLDQGSVVVDAGGYLGDFACEINARYNARVYVYEPIADYYDKICTRLGSNPRINITCAGLGASEQDVRMSLANESSSAHLGLGETMTRVRAFDTEMQRQGITWIDLMKINIEGGEYELLDHIISTGWIDRIGDLQVQFHDFVEDAEAKREQLRQAMTRSHRATYCVPFVWENWRRQENATEIIQCA